MWVIAGQYGMHAYVVMLLSCSGLGGIRAVHYVRIRVLRILESPSSFIGWISVLDTQIVWFFDNLVHTRVV